jgi:SAM-dependent methyltransferase
MACANCGAQWLEGLVRGEPAYRYSHVGELSERYLQGRAIRFAATLKGISDRAGRLLDVGCGTGAFMAAAAANGWEPVGVELSEDAVNLAHRKTGLRVLCGDLCVDDLVEPESFDAVTLWGVLEHVPNAEMLLSACSRLLRPNGYLLLETPNPQGLFRLIAGQLMKFRPSFESPFREMLGAGHVVWYSGRAIEAAARRLQLCVIDIWGSRNSTEILVARWARLPAVQRVLFQASTAVLNQAAAPLGRPNQLTAVLKRG